jgi:hypothetical protein
MVQSKKSFPLGGHSSVTSAGICVWRGGGEADFTHFFCSGLRQIALHRERNPDRMSVQDFPTSPHLSRNPGTR